jgi:hypothetical protein
LGFVFAVGLCMFFVLSCGPLFGVVLYCCWFVIRDYISRRKI